MNPRHHAAAAALAAATALALIPAAGCARLSQGDFANPVTTDATLTREGDAVRVTYKVTTTRDTLPSNLQVLDVESESAFETADTVEEATRDLTRWTKRTDLTVNGQPATFNTPLALHGKAATISYLAQPATTGAMVIWVNTPLTDTRPTNLTVHITDTPESCLMVIGTPKAGPGPWFDPCPAGTFTVTDQPPTQGNYVRENKHATVRVRYTNAAPAPAGASVSPSVS